MSDQLISYAQNREDIILNGLLKGLKTGFYVDVGANHPVRDSVTKIFYDRGWNGINIEPANDLHAVLMLSRPRDINLKCGVSNQNGELVFREYLRGDGLSTFSNEMQDIYKKDEHYSYFAKDYTDHKVPVVKLADLLGEYAKDKRIDFMKIDVEGYEYEAVAGNDWKLYRPVILCIEANHIVKDWHQILKKANYNLVFWDGLNEYFVAEEHSSLTKDFSYADSVFLGEQFISWNEYKIRQDLQREMAALALHLQQTERELHDLQDQLNNKPSHRATGRAKAKLHRVDNKLISLLAPPEKTGLAHDADSLPKNLTELGQLLKTQLAETSPASETLKPVARKIYGKSRRIAKRAVRRGNHE